VWTGDEVAMASGDNLRFGVDLVTFFHPGFWGVDGYDAIIDYAKTYPRAFWDKILDSVEASGVTGVELTFSPFNWQDAIKTYGSVEGFADGALQPRGCTGIRLLRGTGGIRRFHRSAAQAPSPTRPMLYADFIKACGGDIMVIGAPMRQTPAPNRYASTISIKRRSSRIFSIAWVQRSTRRASSLPCTRRRIRSSPRPAMST
jgi:hypothetical protein